RERVKCFRRPRPGNQTFGRDRQRLGKQPSLDCSTQLELCPPGGRVRTAKSPLGAGIQTVVNRKSTLYGHVIKDAKTGRGTPPGALPPAVKRKQRKGKGERKEDGRERTPFYRNTLSAPLAPALPPPPIFAARRRPFPPRAPPISASCAIRAALAASPPPLRTTTPPLRLRRHRCCRFAVVAAAAAALP
ncbi:MAG: hypothetical protein BJ554DRAFT_5179, partial [Olpidium bornovanus]